MTVGGAEISSTEHRISWWLAGVAALLLLIGLANAATLLLVRAAKRARDVAIRSALGASRGRLLSETFAQAILLAGGATVASLALAYWFDEADLLERQMRPWRLGTTLFGLFGIVALAVAAIGLYAAFAHSVSERRRGMAIRIAVGARPSGVMRMVLRESAKLASLGIPAGCAAALVSGRWIQSLLFGMAPSDPLVLASATGVMLLVATLATLVPAMTASRADPNSLLRVE